MSRRSRKTDLANQIVRDDETARERKSAQSRRSVQPVRRAPHRGTRTAMSPRSYVEGASASLNKTITEIMNFLNQKGHRPAGVGADLRPFLTEKLDDLAEHFFKRGFRRGVIECRKVEDVSGRVRYSRRRSLYSSQKRKVRVSK